ncbi:MAG: ATP-dependent protease ATPase subunit HslU, partial [Candidatus Binatia bacterium]
KVEASRFTEVGYVGRDVESIIRDLAELAIDMVREEETAKVQVHARERAEERVLDALLPGEPLATRPGGPQSSPENDETREKLRRLLRAGELDERTVELEPPARQPGAMLEVITPQNLEEAGFDLRETLGNMFGNLRSEQRSQKATVAEALGTLTKEEAQALIDQASVTSEAIRRVEENGIVFLDEIDKICGRDGAAHAGPDVSREGVQRDLLPIVEGSTVKTRHGMVRTDHILFIASGAFNLSKPADLIPEFQGRFPVRVELEALGRGDFIRILTEPRNSLVRQYTALLDTETVHLEFDESAIEEIADIAEKANAQAENVGARRLHTIMERLLDDVSFTAPERGGSTVRIDAGYVREKLGAILEDQDLSRYIL